MKGGPDTAAVLAIGCQPCTYKQSLPLLVQQGACVGQASAGDDTGTVIHPRDFLLLS
jgi:hypothetical protein